MTEPADSARHSARRRPALVGRGREQALLRDRLDAALSGHGSLVLVSGEAGIGKTTLVDALAREAAERGALVLTGHCYDLSVTPPYGPWVEIADSYHSDGALPQLPNSLVEAQALSELRSQNALFDEVRAFFAAVSREQPLLLVLEDLHWADGASLDLLRDIARKIGHLRLMLIVTYRDDEITRRDALYQLLPILTRESQAQRVDLHRLDTDAVRGLVGTRYQLSDEDEKRLTLYLQDHAEGNPFYLGELLRALEDEQLLRLTTHGWTLADPQQVHVPPLVRQIVDQRLAKLGHDLRATLESAAVIGQVVPFDVWRKVVDANEEHLAAVMERAIEARILEETPDGSSLRFTHALVREALYEGLMLPRRRAMHRRVGDALLEESNPDPDAVAHHFQQSGDERAAAWLILAAERAQRSYAFPVAADRFQAALTHMELANGSFQQRGWLLYRIGRVLRYTEAARSLTYLEDARRLGLAEGDGVLAAFALADCGLLHCFCGDIRQGLTEMEAGVSELDALSAGSWTEINDNVMDWVADCLPLTGRRLGTMGNAETAASINVRRGTLALWLASVGRFQEALTNGKPAAAHAPSAVGAIGGYGDALCGLAIAYSGLGQFEAAHRSFSQAQDTYKSIGHHVQVMSAEIEELQQATLVFVPDHIDERERLVTRGTEAQRRSQGMVPSDLPETASRLPVLRIEGNWDEAQRALGAIYQHNVRRNLRGGSLYLTAATQGLIARAQGDTALAWTIVNDGFPTGPDVEPGGISYPTYGLPLQRLAIDLSIDAGDLPAASAWLRANDRWLDWSGTIVGRADSQLLHARYHLAAANPDLASQHAEEALAVAGDPRQPLSLLAAHRFLGQLKAESGHHEAADDHLQQALALAAACSAPYERALTLLVQAELRVRAHRVSEAAVVLDEVQTICTPLKAQPALVQVEALRAKMAVTRSPARYPAGLTQREVDVLQLVASGLTDAEVAERLYISRRTVTSHLTSIYTKLEVASRTAATRFAIEHNLA